MPDYTLGSGDPDTLPALKTRIAALEGELLLAKAKEQAARKVAGEAYTLNAALKKRNKWLEDRNRQLEDPKGRLAIGLSWLGQVIQIIDRVGRPLRSREIMHELKAIDAKGALLAMANADTHLSVVLTKAVRSGRLRIFKFPGTKGRILFS